MNTEKYEKLGKLLAALDAAKKKAIGERCLEETADQAEGKKLFDGLKERIFRDEMLKAKRRPDGRKFDQVRKDPRVRSGRAAAHSRFVALYPRRNAGAGDGDARHQR